MELVIIIIFVVGYLLITLEHSLKIDKAAPALLLGVLTWAAYTLFTGDYHAEVPDYAHGGELATVLHQLEHHLPEIVNILFFLLGAMTIVEAIDIHDGFHAITSRITTRNKSRLLWILCFLTFFMSATLDNLTTAIVMASLLGKLLPSPEDRQSRLLFASIIIIAANAGGAWSPIGDVTTTMLWIGNQITVGNIIASLIIPSLVCMIAPLIVVTWTMKGEFAPLKMKTSYKTTGFERVLVLCVGVACLIFVPIFKTITHLPPFMGMFFGVGVMWVLTELLHKKKTHEEKSEYSILHALTKIDAASILFFFGILAGVACLSSIGTLGKVAEFLNNTIGNDNMDVIVLIIGALSAIVDNVPLVAATMQMYPLEVFPTDSKMWEFLAYCAGTGGSLLVIGSAAGVAIMGIEKIEFFWYMKRITFLALIGYLAGAATYLLLYPIMPI